MDPGMCLSIIRIQPLLLEFDQRYQQREKLGEDRHAVDETQDRLALLLASSIDSSKSFFSQTPERCFKAEFLP